MDGSGRGLSPARRVDRGGDGSFLLLASTVASDWQRTGSFPMLEGVLFAVYAIYGERALVKLGVTETAEAYIDQDASDCLVVSARSIPTASKQSQLAPGHGWPSSRKTGRASSCAASTRAVSAPPQGVA